jgi:hypothetical protein
MNRWLLFSKDGKMIPRKIDILGDTIQIKQVDDATMDKFNGKSDETLGLALLLESITLIRSTCPNPSKKKILVHEFVHFALYQSGISQSISPEIEEALCQTFSRLYFQLKKQGI